MNYNFHLPPIDKKSGAGTIYWSEHAPVAILEQADISIIISYPGKDSPEHTDENRFYMDILSYDLNESFEKRAAQASPVHATALEMKKARDDKKIVGENSDERVAHIILHDNAPPLAKRAFQTLCQQVSQRFSKAAAPCP
ncbi:MAG: hypothetical protein PHS57_05370 [Alphaproteobacteria bacterium]|nr:hypothetical protein [Alphaproteobacteria bacterium]